ncbi:GDP-L-fucose synthase family protein [Nocardioides sp. AX2bis]|uniref:GDP-L-fucose synthase family protein n=1 Tax=Nocardioides sp. AX2bis TaxID=2653157 RepID=UPI0012F0F3FA|nr:GDP-L-fucose synthase [Nocardioides sp. AX2bis]VXC52721.1 bifunctional GDP-fucose synthetase: GDP-4-dehydro-6-deoxy-D-mannose epimerase and GDP-4-dehydro-6-L-deoxygalactose reductase [Nocardioides sp. AX2bis]
MAPAPFALQPGTRVYVAGHRGLAGSAVWRALGARPGLELVGRTSSQLDLRDRAGVAAFMQEVRPDVVVLAAARVGGIKANRDYPLDFLSDNLQIQVNVMDAAVAAGVQRLLFLGSSCVYPKFAPQPIREESLLTGLLEPTNDAYAIAKIAGLLQVQAVRRQHGLPWISAMPTNLYGPEDNFDPESSHVLASLIRRYDDAVRRGDRSVTNWGSGAPRREFLHVDDLAEACLHLLEAYDDPSPVNVGTGTDLSIAELAGLVASATGYEGETRWDETYPDGTPRKLLDVSRLTASGWSARTGLAEGLVETVSWYRQQKS